MDTKCQKCGQEMRKIGPFARRKEEGEPAYKSDGTAKYQCANEECEDYGKIVTLKE